MSDDRPKSSVRRLVAVVSGVVAVGLAVGVSAVVLASRPAPAPTANGNASARPTTPSIGSSPFGSAYASAAPTAVPVSTTPNAASIVAVAQKVFGTDTRGGVTTCSPQQCPVTPRLLNRLLTARVNANLWTRSQYGWMNPSFSGEVTARGAVAHVLLFVQGTAGANELDLLLVRDGHGGWLVDDTQCTTRPNPTTSIYVAEPPPCY